MCQQQVILTFLLSLLILNHFPFWEKYILGQTKTNSAISSHKSGVETESVQRILNSPLFFPLRFHFILHTLSSLFFFWYCRQKPTSVSVDRGNTTFQIWDVYSVYILLELEDRSSVHLDHSASMSIIIEQLVLLSRILDTKWNVR